MKPDWSRVTKTFGSQSKETEIMEQKALESAAVTETVLYLKKHCSSEPEDLNFTMLEIQGPVGRSQSLLQTGRTAPLLKDHYLF